MFNKGNPIEVSDQGHQADYWMEDAPYLATGSVQFS